MSGIRLGMVAAWHNGSFIIRNIPLNQTIYRTMAKIADCQLQAVNENPHFAKIFLKGPDKVYIGSNQNDDDPILNSFSDKNRCDITDIYKEFCESLRKKNA